MSYTIFLSEKAKKQLKKLPKEVQKRIISTLRRCMIRPHSHVKRLVGLPYYKLRVGEYRVVMSILENELQIHVIEIGHRKNIYK